MTSRDHDVPGGAPLALADRRLERWSCEVAWTRRPVLVAVALGLLSATLETTQSLLPALGRSCSTNDRLANSFGAVIGALLGWSGLRWALTRGTD